MQKSFFRLTLSLSLLFSFALANAGILEIYCVNVGQGDATLIVGPSGKTVLIDSGQNQSSARKILNLMNSLGIEKLDYTIATHYDQDHIGAFCSIFSVIGPPQIAAYDRGGDRRASASSAQPSFFLNYISCTGSKRTRLEPGSVIDLGDGAKILVIAVGDPDYMTKGGTSDYTKLFDGTKLECANYENEKSIALLITYGGFDFLLSGDLTGIDNPPNNCSHDSVNVELRVGELIVGAPLYRNVDIFRLNHHGSDSTSNTIRYLSLIKPEVAIISVGDSPACGAGFNNYGHPGQGALNALSAAGVRKIYQTEQGGCKWINTPVTCTPKPNETCPRNYHNIPHDFLYDQHVVILTDGRKYQIKNALGEWEYYNVDDDSADD